MNILVTGANGQLGNEMRIVAKTDSNNQWLFTDIMELDLTNAEAVLQYITEHHVQAVVNCAAYTNVDKAESDEQTAYLINATAAVFLAQAAQQVGALLIHVSTDYVFDGQSFLPYKESDATSPATAYGRTKLAGEQMLLSICPNAVIIRTAWLYSSFGNNFVKTMLRLAAERDMLQVVYDQIGTPTYAADLAEAIYTILSCERSSIEGGVYHFTNLGVCSWYDFAVQILAQAGSTCKVVPIRSEQYPAKTPRPHYSVLDKQKIIDAFGITIPHWTNSLSRCISLLQKQNDGVD